MKLKISNDFFRGMSAFFNPKQTHRRIIRQTDYEALASDWIAVGNDIRSAMVRYERETESSGGQNLPLRSH